MMILSTHVRAVTRAHNGFGWWALRLLAPERGLRAYEALYAYFRWADDIVDAPGRDVEAVGRFVAAQEALRVGARAAEGLDEEALDEALRLEPRLRGVASVMGQALAFDARRTAAPLSRADLDRQVRRVGDSYLKAVWICLGEPLEPPGGVALLARAATRVHLLRDHRLDLSLGYDNRQPDGDGAPIPTGEWAIALASQAQAEFRSGGDALGSVPRWRTRWLLRLWAWRYRRALPRLVRALNSPKPAEA